MLVDDKTVLSREGGKYMDRLTQTNAYEHVRVQNVPPRDAQGQRATQGVGKGACIDGGAVEHPIHVNDETIWLREEYTDMDGLAHRNGWKHVRENNVKHRYKQEQRATQRGDNGACVDGGGEGEHPTRCE